MKTEILSLAFLTLLIMPGMSSEGLQSLTVLRAAGESAASTPGLSPALQALAEMHPIDVHTHVFKKATAFDDLLKRIQLRVLDICVVDDRDPFFKDFERQRNLVLDLVRGSSGRVGFCTTISPYDFEEPEFAQRVNHQLNQDFSAGAIAVKIYKTIGMEIRSKAGKYLMPDDPVFEPIYKNIVSHHKTIIAHLAEPDSCWQPRNPASPDYDYYEKHPEEYAHLHPEWPSKAAILAARDHVLAMNPMLRVVGAHLGSMEVNVNEMAQCFDRYPNFAVDTAARIPYFMLQPSERVRAFLIKYQDRVLYGTDLELMPENDVMKALKEWTNTYERDWKYFATDQTVEYNGHKTQGLRLPESVLHKLYQDNAIRWIPGIGTRP